jgi:serine/threonine protein kinase
VGGVDSEPISAPSLPRGGLQVDADAPHEVHGSADESVRNVYPVERIVGGRYIIEERVGEGGMGRIYKVRHRDLGKLFALKIIHQNLAQQPHIRDAFYREARMASSMNHPNIVSVFDFGVDNVHGAFIVMEYLSGETLADRLAREGRIEAKAACDIVLQSAEALSFIHSLGVIHCDIKPENVFLCHATQSSDVRRNSVRLLDFGLASRPAIDSREIVAATTVAGTPTYLAPERIRAQAPTPASDIYALGVLFYECLTGQPPFDGRLQEIIYGHLRREPVPPSQKLGRPYAAIAHSLEQLVLTALAKEPAQRPGSAAEFAFALRHVMAELGVARRLDAVVQPASPRADLCEALVDSCPLPMFVASPTGEMLFGNAALGGLLGIHPTELRGKLSSTLLGKWCPRIERDVRQVLARKRASRHTLVVHSPSGEARGGWLTLAPFRRDGDVVGVCGIVSLMGDAEAD